MLATHPGASQNVPARGGRFPEPAELAAGAERGLSVPVGPGACFAGYAVLGVGFASGDVLALRRFPAASEGPGYTSVWHRDPAGAWTFYADVPPGEGCSRYFAPALRETVVAPIRLEWTSPRRLEIRVDGGRLLAWSLCLGSSWRTRLLNAVAAHLPARMWLSPRGLALVGFAARVTLGLGPVRLTGLTPTGTTFFANPMVIWTIASSRASIAGRDPGVAATLPAPIALGDFRIPRRGLFAMGRAFMVNTRR